MTKLYLARHGETEWNRIRRVQGSTDTELNAEGIRQARKLAKRLSKESINIIYSSSLKRALKTAEIAAEYINCEVVKSEKYHEMRLGPWEGMTLNEIRENYGEHFRVYRENPANFRMPGAETFPDLTERTYNAISEIVKKHNSENILVVSHGTAIKAAIMRILEIDMNNYAKFRIDNASITIIGFPEDNPGNPVIFCLNDTGHLKEA